MGTRSITTVTRCWGGGEPDTYATIYRHFDGYPEEQGKLLADFLDGLDVVNRTPVNDRAANRLASGPGDLAAQLVCKMAEDGAKPKLLPAGTIAGQEFHYDVRVDRGRDGGQVSVTVYAGPMTMFGGGGEGCNNEIFRGTPAEFSSFVKEIPERFL